MAHNLSLNRRWFTPLSFVLLMSFLVVAFMSGGNVSEQAQASTHMVSVADFGEPIDSSDMPTILIVKVRFDEATETPAVGNYGLGHGVVHRPGASLQHGYLYQALSRAGDVLAEGTFDFVLPLRPADLAAAVPDDVVHLADDSVLIRIPYDPHIASLRVLKLLTPEQAEAWQERAAQEKRDATFVLSTHIGQVAVMLASGQVEAANAEMIREELAYIEEDEPMDQPGDLISYLQSQLEAEFRLNSDTPRGAGQNEPFIAINPANPQNIVAGANESARMGVYYTTNGGQQWRATTVPLPSGLRNSSDPGIAADAQGNFYYSFIAFNSSSGGALSDNGVFVSKSTNGGQTFRAPVPVVQHLREPGAPFEDKEFIAADSNPTSPYVNNVYVTWTSFTGQTAAIMFSRSTDGGQRFSQPLVLRRAGSQQFSLPVVGPNGDVYVVWQLATFHRITRSLDGGVTFERDRPAVSGINIIGTLDPDTGRRLLNGGFRVSSYPSMAADTSNSPHRGNLYLTWSDARNGDADILLVRSTDGGQTWSQPVRINDDPVGNGRDQFFQWIAVDPTNGQIVVMFYDRRADPNNLILDVYITRSTDGGLTFEPNIKVNTVAFNPRDDRVFQGTFIGDYNALAVYGNLAYPVWSDTRRRELDIFGSRVRFNP